ncbi:amidohydrolase [Desulfomicrobium sp. ZS1]|uniref:M20 metallopeptidase family protein n=1 Tax=Desulfomicrobium sp. ZS1 TaxID=2952228 RepID=UPI0020B411A4|nr:amidohydrolase [Desulfomicrobium sp. ZS1]UTF51172.1 amidohydrolase [Desulfomicrobium sp. ZS1]
MIANLLARSREELDYVRAIRRELHRFPEVGTDLPRTRALVLRELGKLNLSVREDVGGGIVADLHGQKGSSRIALRADMDALPIQEESGLEFASEISGQSHMCGHDAHTAMLLGAARLASGRGRTSHAGIRFLFQPNEEFQPGGAKAMTEAGCLDDVSEVYGLHVWPGQPTGWFGTRQGPLMARPDVFSITLTGKGGHASAPHQCIDPILAGSHLVAALQGIVSRRVAPHDRAVLSVTRFQAGSSYNIIPDTAFLQGTVRTLDEGTGDLVQTEMQRLVSGLAASMNVRAELDYQRGYPVVVNDAPSTDRAVKVLRGISDNVDAGIEPVMAGEDFSYYLNKVPGCFIFMGCGHCGADGRGGLHNACFNLDEDCLTWGVAALVGLALQKA